MPHPAPSDDDDGVGRSGAQDLARTMMAVGVLLIVAASLLAIFAL